MKNNMLFVLFVLFFSFSGFTQFEFKVDLTKENLISGSDAFTIGNTMYYFNIAEVKSVNLKNGAFLTLMWEDMEGKVLNKANLKG